MNDADLADEIIARLNKLCEDPDVRRDIGKLIESRIDCSTATADHPSIQAQSKEVGEGPVGLCECGAYGGSCELCKPTMFQIGLLGVLNGLVGTLPDGKRKGWATSRRTSTTPTRRI